MTAQNAIKFLRFEMSTSKIFVQISSYRDSDLVPTISNCLKQAKYPDNLIFSICRQYDEIPQIPQIMLGHQFRVSNYHWTESKGPGWARHHTQKKYNGEPFTIQIQARARFLPCWDEMLMSIFRQINSDKPIITAYPLHLKCDNNHHKTLSPTKTTLEFFGGGGTIIVNNVPIPNWETLSRPVAARVVASPFFFTLGSHCYECPSDPAAYGAYEDWSLTLRSYTQGYDIFHPHRPILWYQQFDNRPRMHWDDHTEMAKRNGLIAESWNSLNQIGLFRLKHLLGQMDGDINMGDFGLGNKRSLEDYQRYAGVDFKKQLIHRDAHRGVEPPCKNPDAFDFYSNRYEITGIINKNDFPSTLKNTLWDIGIVDHRFKTIERYSVTLQDIDSVVSGNELIIKLTIESESRPFSIFVEPRNNSSVDKPIFKKLQSVIPLFPA